MQTTHRATRTPRRRPCTGDLQRVVVALVARTALWTVLLLAAWSVLPAALGWQVTTVVSGSMTPAVAVGDVVAAMPIEPERISAGHVLLVDDPDHEERLRLHRVERVLDDGTYRLRGDANPAADRSPVAAAAVRGVGVLRSPGVGLPGMWLRTGEWTALLAAAAALGLLAVLARADRSVRAGTPCRRCGAPRWALGHEVQTTRGVAATPVLGVSAAVLTVALVTGTGAGAWDTASTDSRGALGSGLFPCFSELLDDPLIAWDFAERGGSSIIDTSGHGCDGQFSSAIERVDGSCADNPHTRSTSTPAGVHGTVPMTSPVVFSAEAWFRTTEAHGRIVGFSNKSGGGSTSFDRHAYIATDGTLVFGVTAAGVVRTTTPVTDGRWHHVVCTSDGTTAALWLDGTLVGSGTASGAATYTGYWRAGYDNLRGWPGATTTSHYLAGNLDTVRFYDHTLDAAAVQRHFAAGR